MTELKLVAPASDEPVRQRRWVEWRFTDGETAAIRGGIEASGVDRPVAMRKLLATLAYCTRARRRPPRHRTVDLRGNRFVVSQLRRSSRPGLGQEVWAICLENACVSSGTVKLGVSELAHAVGDSRFHVCDVLADLVAMNALIKRVAYPDGPDYVVNAHVLPPPGGELVEEEQRAHGPLRDEFGRRRGASGS